MKIGQVGTGHAHAAGKMATLRKLSHRFEVVGIVEPSIERQEAHADEDAYRGLRWMEEEELLETPGVQIVAVETTVDELVPTAARCIQAGVHVHLDKAPGESFAAFRDLLCEASRNNLVVQLGYMYRYNPAFQFLFRAVSEGWIGDIFEVHGVISKVADETLRRELRDCRGGSMFELGCHLVDPLVTILGKPERVIPLVKKTRPERDDLADNMLAVFQFARATATLRSTLVEVDGAQRRQFVVCGDRGTVEIRPHEPPGVRLTLAEPCAEFRAGSQSVRLPRMPGRYDDQLLDLARVVNGEKENEYPAPHDLLVHESLLRACALPIS